MWMMLWRVKQQKKNCETELAKPFGKTNDDKPVPQLSPPQMYQGNLATRR